MKIKTSELIGPPLEWAAAVCEGHNVVVLTVQEQKERWFQHVEPKDLEKEQKAFADYIEETLRPEIRVLSDDGYKRYPTHQEAPMLFGQGLPSFRYSTDPAQAWPIIDRERITVSSLYAQSLDAPAEYRLDEWGAYIPNGVQSIGNSSGPSGLIAAMRCYVASKMGDEVDVPEELICR